MTLWNDKRTPAGITTDGNGDHHDMASGRTFSSNPGGEAPLPPDHGEIADTMIDHLNNNYTHGFNRNELADVAGVHPAVAGAVMNHAFKNGDVVKLGGNSGPSAKYAAHPAYKMHHGIA